MNRREFVQAGLGGALAASTFQAQAGAMMNTAFDTDKYKALFARAQNAILLNAAGGTPLSAMTEQALSRFKEFWATGVGPEPWTNIPHMMDEVRASLARFIGAQPSEIAFTQCTKAGEQIVIDRLEAIRQGGNLVTNDLHFAGSLHNYLGLKQGGLDVRIVKSRNFEVSLEAMGEAIDDDTALVAVAYVSNINGRFEPLPELSKIAHDHGAYVYADLIQATGIVPVNVEAMGIDFAASNGFKWLFGPHGTGFFYAKQELQGTALNDELFPGHARHNYEPWTTEPDAAQGDYKLSIRGDASRYQTGHVNYLGYCCLQAGLEFIEQVGVAALQEHSVRLCQRLREGLDSKRFPCLTPGSDRSPIISFGIDDREGLRERLRAERIFVSLAPTFMRVSPGIYSTEGDIDHLMRVLNEMI